MTYYIQRKGLGHLETVDEVTHHSVAECLLLEYRYADPSAHYYLSRRACRAWQQR